MIKLLVICVTGSVLLASCHSLSRKSQNSGAEYVFKEYSDGRPQASKRMNARDEGIVLRHGDGPDSCDVYGAREAIVFEENGLYYLHYDGAGKAGWQACLAVSRDLTAWTKKGVVLRLGEAGKLDCKSASSPWVIKEGKTWHMFYLGTPNVSPPPDRIPSFPYLTMKARSASPEGPWEKQYDVVPFVPRKGTYYEATASPGFIVNSGSEFLQFFSASIMAGPNIKRTLGIARTNDLDATWKVDAAPIMPLEEQIENSSLFFEEKNNRWFLFTNHIGLDEKGVEYTDAIWVYWSNDLNTWNVHDKAIVLDGQNCTWANGTIGMPSVIKVGTKLALLYDGREGKSTEHMRRDIGLAWLDLPLEPVSE
jgi:predicted GH43/DUF377 family glycosyl hydrolase